MKALSQPCSVCGTSLRTKLCYSSYALIKTNKLMSRTFDPLYSCNLKAAAADCFCSAERIISIGTKQVPFNQY